MSDDLLPAGRRIGHLGALAGIRMTGRGCSAIPDGDGLSYRYAVRFLRGPEMRKARADHAVRAWCEAAGVVFYADGTMSSAYERARIYPEAYLQEAEAMDVQALAEWDERMKPENQRRAALGAVRRGLKAGDPDAKAYIDAVREANREERKAAP